jgi:lipopolysaccharide heptosyltransferase II
VDWYLEVLRILKVPIHWNFTWLPARPEVAAAIRSNGAARSGRWIILQPGARWLNKRWPVEHFAALVQRLTATNPEIHCAILGGPEDQPLGETIARIAPTRCLDLTGKLSLPEMVEWIRLGEATVTNDTGPMHVAAALGKPVIAMFGPTEPRRTGPYGQIEHALQFNLPCIPCMKAYCTYRKPIECLRAITPELVFKGVQKRTVNIQP